MPAVFTAADARHWALLTRAALAARRTEIDALNVFPVPDGDTGTNLYLTFDAAIDEVVAAHEAAGILGEATLVQECRSLRRAILLSARGNSGVIVSQLVGGLCDTVIERDAEVVDALLLGEAFARGAAAARACVAHPQEGTILTVADAGAAAAVEAAEAGGSVADVCEAAVDAAQQALARTPDQLEALRRAGVVDAGGAGCVLMLESFHRVVTGLWSATDSGLLSAGPALHRRAEWRHKPAAAGVGADVVRGPDGPGGPDAVAWPPPEGPGTMPGHDPLDTAADRLGGGPAYEVMYLLGDATPEAVATLRDTLDGLGDSLIVVGGPDLWNVHVHVDDPGAAVEAGVVAGRPERIRITHFAAQVATRDHPVPLAVVACAAGPGIARLLEDAGAVAVASGPGHRASAGQLLDAVHATGSRSVVLLPGDRDTLLAAEVAAQAAGAEGVDVHVVPARTTVQALAALAVLDPARPVHANVVSMTGAAVATREVLARLLSAGGELVTLVVGADAEPGLGRRVAAALERDRPDVEVVVIDGGQPFYPLLVGVE